MSTLREYEQQNAESSPWSIAQRIKMLAWEYCWILFCVWTPKPMNIWRCFWLKLFGAKLIGKPFVHQRARIQIPWNVELRDKSCVGDRANLYSLDKIVLQEGATVAQEVYLCTGTHAFVKESMNLITSPIVIRKNVFVGARAFVMPGVVINEDAVVAAMTVVTKMVPSGAVVAGNPGKVIKQRAQL